MINFPPTKYNETTSSPPKSTLAVSKERYIVVREKINKAVQGSGVILSDNHLAIIIKNKEGYLTLSRDLKPSKQV